MSLGWLEVCDMPDPPTQEELLADTEAKIELCATLANCVSRCRDMLIARKAFLVHPVYTPTVDLGDFEDVDAAMYAGLLTAIETAADALGTES